ncbi:unnamed protein product [Mytilus coruscus]|uniref:G-protein coupled receptors family 1 profile domain-containing protein n=1 Tax=Mytilus coruscus TaxID=42192 RepID=A0A6J8AT37_MYTCO|nr:unnamed protein product [Mytilus coruscus]
MENSADHTVVISTVNAFHSREYYTEQIVNQKLVAPIIYLIILLLIGPPGNISILIIYRNYNKNVYRKIIWIIAVVDLLICLIGVPFNLGRLFNYYNFQSLRACRIVAGLLDSGIMTSTQLLVLLTIHRYRQVCYPLKRQITIQNVTYFIGACFAIGIVSGIPQIAVLQPLAETDFGHGVTGYTCSVAWKDSPQGWKNYNIFLSSLFLFYTLLLFVLYAFIGRTLLRLKRKRRTDNNRENAQYNRSAGLSMKITKIAFTVSLVFAISYLPLFLNEVAIKDFDETKLSWSTFALLKIVQRSYLINHVANPFIYYRFDNHFRSRLNSCFMTIARCKKIDNNKKQTNNMNGSPRKTDSGI